MARRVNKKFLTILSLLIMGGLISLVVLPKVLHKQDTGVLWQEQDALVFLAYAQFAFRADHPIGGNAANLGALPLAGARFPLIPLEQILAAIERLFHKCARHVRPRAVRPRRA